MRPPVRAYTIEYRLTGRGACSLRAERWSQAQVIGCDPETAGAIMTQFLHDRPELTFRFRPAAIAQAAGAR